MDNSFIYLFIILTPSTLWWTAGTEPDYSLLLHCPVPVSFTYTIVITKHAGKLSKSIQCGQPIQFENRLSTVNPHPVFSSSMYICLRN